MKQQTNIEILKYLLQTKETMEKSQAFGENALRRVREANPVNRLKVVQLHSEIQNFRAATGAARKSIGASLAASLIVRPKVSSKPESCKRCGAKVIPGAAFCGACGARLS